MDMGAFQTFLTDFGFPVACVVFLGWFIFKIWMNQQQQNVTREEKLYDSLGKAQVINQELTKSNSEFVSVLNAYKVDLEEIKANVSDIKERIK